MKALTEAIRKWNKEIFGKLESCKISCLEKIAKIDAKEQEGSLFQGVDKIKREEEQCIYLNWLQLEEISWRQKAHVAWLKERDKKRATFCTRLLLTRNLVGKMYAALPPF